MLIINADDWGADAFITARIMDCVKNMAVNSVSVMVFMEDSEKAADIALCNGIDSGLHLNFTEPFSGNVSVRLREHHNRIVTYLRKNKFAQLIYNPMLKNDFNYDYKKQVEEYVRLYGKVPMRIDGHNHMHLCANVLIENLIPRGIFVRRNNTFFRGEKDVFNRTYRAFIDAVLKKRYRCTDYFFHIHQIAKSKNRELTILKIKDLAKVSIIEILVHPHQEFDYQFVMSRNFSDTFSGVRRGCFENLKINENMMIQ